MQGPLPPSLMSPGAVVGFCKSSGSPLAPLGIGSLSARAVVCGRHVGDVSYRK